MHVCRYNMVCGNLLYINCKHVMVRRRYICVQIKEYHSNAMSKSNVHSRRVTKVNSERSYRLCQFRIHTEI